MSGLRGAALHWDCFAGAAGDMCVAALVDLGVPEEVVTGALAALRVEGYQVGFSTVKRGSLVGRKFRVEEHGHGHGHHHAHAHEHEHAHRHWADIRRLIEGAAIGDGVKRRAIAIFERIARVEAKLHGAALEEVAFHEVGAIDSIVDVVGVAAALEWIAPSRVTARRVPLGRGRVKSAHGMLPVPAPATLELLVGAEVEEGGADGELTTPTGAAILAATVEQYGAPPPMEVLAVGWGAGERELPDRPNLLRVVAGRAAEEGAAPGAMLVLEANVDDMTPELAAPLVEALLDAGARDAWLAPLLMKKGRPALLVGALCDASARSAVEATLFRESTTIGVRAHAVDRTALARRIVEVETPYGRVPVKVSGPGGDDEAANAAPEFEACRALARERGVPVKRVWAEALAAFYQGPGRGTRP